MIAVSLAIIFIFVYVIMAKGYVPGTKLARTEVAIIGGILVLLTGAIPLASIPSVIEYQTLIILLVLMLISAQFNLTAFYNWCATKIAAYPGSSVVLLFLVVMVAGVLSALLVNDVIAFAMTPILCHGLSKRNINPKPFLLALMAGCNVGSAATIVGNPQNILIAEYGKLTFWGFLKVCGMPSLMALLVMFMLVWLVCRKELCQQPRTKELYLPSVERKQTAFGLFVLAILLGLFFTEIPRYLSAIIVGLIFLVIRWRYVRSLLVMIDWRLLLLFMGLFIVNKGFAQTGIPTAAVDWLIEHGINLQHMWVLAPYAFIGSNTISNVPAVILTLTMWPQQSAQTLYGLALLTTFAGNAFIFSSLANIIVIERARVSGVKIYFAEHVKVGLPVTLITLLLAVWWLKLVA